MAEVCTGELLLAYAEHREMDMRDGPTDEEQLERGVTDEPAADAGEIGALLTTVARVDDLEHRRLVGSARHKLFGRGPRLKIGRYQVERRIGAGGMGEVYLALDEDLGREVAIKRVLDTAADERHQQRLRREARGLARLSHPNVVQVYEVGEHEGRTYIAMEYVAGQTLGQWLGEQERPWRTVVDVLVQAGRGLAAAHAAGLVHRDFKPDNVLIGDDGSVRVADFGLVLADETPRAEGYDGSASTPRALSVTGPFQGTIRYMPLEQLLGDKLDARSDQFSFCVTLYEALWGEPPFSLASVAERIEALQHGSPDTPPSRGRGSRPPAGLWRVLRRGLSREPEDRWPDLDALLAAIERVCSRRRVVWASAAVVASTLAAGVVMAGGDAPADPCAAVDRELASAWSDERQADLDARFAALSVGHAADSRDRVVAGLDRWAATWVEHRARACRLSEEQRVEPEVGRQRNRCLIRHRQRVEDLVDLLTASSADEPMFARSVEAVAQLPPVSACDDELALVGVEPPPLEQEEEVEGVRRQIARAEQLRRLGRMEEGLAAAQRGEQAARALGYGPLEAEAQAEHAKAELAAGSLARGIELMEAAIDTAEIQRHDGLVAELWTSLALRTLTEVRDQTAGHWRYRRAVAASQRVDGSDRLRVRLALGRGHLAALQGDDAEAERAFREALAQTEQNPDATLERPSALSNLARVAMKRDPDEGLSLYRAALEAAELIYGVEHPYTAGHRYRLAVELRRRDPQDPEIFALLEHVARVWTQAHSQRHRDLAKAQLVLAVMALERGDVEAGEAYARALVETQASKGPDDRSLDGETAHLLANLHSISGEPEQALAQLRVALELWTSRFGATAPQIIRLRNELVSALLSLERLDEASAILDALATTEPGSPAGILTQLHRGELALRRGQLEQARTELDALADLPDLGVHAFTYALLDALVAVRRSALDRATVERLRKAHATTSFLPEQVEAFLEGLQVSDDERSALELP